MKDESPQVKDLLEIQDTDTSDPEPIQGYQELLKAEKILTGDTYPHNLKAKLLTWKAFFTAPTSPK